MAAGALRINRFPAVSDEASFSEPIRPARSCLDGKATAMRRIVFAALLAFPPAAFAKEPVVVAPLVAAPRSGGIASVVLENNGAAAVPARIVSFGHVFASGAIAKGQTIAASSEGTVLSAAMDAKAHYSDGSVLHGIVSLAAPPLAAGARRIVTLSLGGSAEPSAPIKPGDILLPGYEPKINFTFQGTAEPRIVDVAKLASEALAGGTAETWLDNALVKEIRVSTKLNAQMTAIVDIRATADGQVKTDMIIANDQAFVPAQAFTYDVSVDNAGSVLFERKAIAQYPYSNWHKEFWTGAERSKVHVAFDPEYLAKTGAIPEYDFSLGVSQKAIADSVSTQAKAKTGPMNSSQITTWMETTGGRTDIGVTTGWAANYLVSQDPDAEAVMLAQADSAGSVPWHLRDGATNAPVSIDRHPTAWADGRAGTAYKSAPADQWGSGFDTAQAQTQGGWGLDTAHEPDLSFIPYLITGDHYYLDELESQAAYLTVAGHPGYRKLGQGLFFFVDQERGIAWNLRDVANAGWIAPDTDPLKATFNGNLLNNLANLASVMAEIHTSGSEGEIEGYLPDGMSGTNMTAPWQNTYLAVVMEQLARRGNAAAKSLAAWLDRYNSGLYTHGAQGYNPFNGPGYWLYVDNGSGVPAGKASQGTKPNSWAQFYNFNFGGQPVPTTLQNYVNCTYCYPAYSTMGAAEAFSSTGSVQALWAYAYLIANTSVLLQPTGYVNDPSWHVTPVLPDGYHLKQSDIQVVPDTGGTISATGAHSVLAGGAGHNVLDGGSGWTLMYAGGGGAVMNARSGTTYMIAGAGEGGKPSKLTVDASAEGQEIVLDFDPALDRLEIRNAGALTLASPSWIAADAVGGSVLTLGPAHKATVQGIAPAALVPAITLH
jgi:hypothetical protein